MLPTALSKNRVPELPPLLVFSDDWGRHPSSCQHLITRLLPHRTVIWVNTIGTRPPRLDRSTLMRGLEKLRHWTLGQHSPAALKTAAHTGAGGETPTSPVIVNPKMWPSFRSRFSRTLNRRLLTRALRPVVDACPVPPIVVTTVPLLADLVGQFRASRWVYYCVDDFSAWPGLDGRTLRSIEVELVAKVDVAIAASERLQSHLAGLSKPAHLLTHGVDLAFWRAARPIASEPPWLADLRKLDRPLIVFWGVIDRRLDLEFIRTLGEALTEGVLLFVGPQDHPDPGLPRVPRVHLFPALPFEDLPILASQAAVFIAPYADLPVTRAMQPLKLKEYLATVKSVVVRKLPATESWADCADVIDNAGAFTAIVLERLQSGVPPDQQRARARLELESWDAKAQQFERWIDGGE